MVAHDVPSVVIDQLVPGFAGLDGLEDAVDVGRARAKSEIRIDTGMPSRKVETVLVLDINPLGKNDVGVVRILEYMLVACNNGHN